MTSLTLRKLSLEELKAVVELETERSQVFEWLNVDDIALTQDDEEQLRRLKDLLERTRTHLLNEATTWARVIYPLLLLAEQGSIQAWSEVSLASVYPQFSLDGIADGVLGESVNGYLEAPYLVVVEAKKGLEGSNPLFQLYGQMLAAARINWEGNQRDPQEIFGCYTISDSWTFFRAEVSGIESERPKLSLESSGEFSERFQAELILKILKKIVSEGDTRIRTGG